MSLQKGNKNVNVCILRKGTSSSTDLKQRLQARRDLKTHHHSWNTHGPYGLLYAGDPQLRAAWTYRNMTEIRQNTGVTLVCMQSINIL